jgi:hypothetical protein
VGNYEGASEVSYGDSQHMGDSLQIPATLLYMDARFPKASVNRTVAWTDTLVLMRSDAHWMIQDIKLAHSKSLLASLQEYLDEGKRSCVKQ